MTSGSAISSSSSIVWSESVSDDDDFSELERLSELGELCNRQKGRDVSITLSAAEVDGVHTSDFEESSNQAEMRRENSRLRKNSIRARLCSDVSTNGCNLPRWSYCTESSVAAHGDRLAGGAMSME